MSIYRDFLKAMFEATKQQRLLWKEERPGEFVTKGAISVTIRLVAPLVAGPTETIGPQAFQIEAGRLSFSVWDGSENCDLVRDTLASGIPEWGKQQKQVVDRLSDLIHRLTN